MLQKVNERINELLEEEEESRTKEVKAKRERYEWDVCSKRHITNDHDTQF